MLRPFHLAFPIYDLNEAKIWYTKYLDCKIGRESSKWIDFNFYGHQISAHLVPKKENNIITNEVDQKNIPVRHFGIILEWEQWQELSSKLIKLNIEFIVKPYLRFKGKIGEQATMFIKDPSDNCIEFKSFKNDNYIFTSDKI
tara:strand:- start:140 stop:565 length:426 start_codon:yes stop_codon:yes gene_type:complete